MKKVLNMIVEGMPHLEGLEEEIELDLATIPDKTLWRLLKFAIRIQEKNGVKKVKKGKVDRMDKVESESSGSEVCFIISWGLLLVRGWEI